MSSKSIDFALIEGTPNQVNQFGGYTGMSPVDFRDLIFEIAEKYRVNEEQIVLGGDHLRPFPWRNEDREIALANAKTLVNHMLKQDLGNFILI